MPLPIRVYVCLGLCLIGAAGGAVQIDCDAPPPPLLSAYGLFSDMAKRTPAEGVTPFSLSSLLFTDYAAKHRLVWMPEGSAAQYRDPGVFEFPTGAVLVKTLALPRDLRDPAAGERPIETRLLIKGRNGWRALPYVWNDEGSDARLALAGARVPVEWTHTDGSQRAQQWVVPNVNQCKQCHLSYGEMKPTGIKARYLNCDYAYDAGSENQLAHWTRSGLLEGAPAPEAAPRAPRWDDADAAPLDARARSYLDMNCAFCHSPGGTAYTSGLDLSSDQTAPYRYGVLKAPVAAGRSAIAGFYDIVPGDPEASILLFRMATVDPGMRMPVLGRNLVHEEGVELIRAWIAAMPHSEGTAGAHTP